MSQRTKVVGARAPIIWLLIVIAVVLVAALAVAALVIYPDYQRQHEVEQHYQAGVAFQDVGEWDKAVEAFERVIAIDATYKDARTRLAEVKVRRQEALATAQAKAAQATTTAQARAEATAAAATTEAKIAQATSVAATVTAQARATSQAQEAKATATAEAVAQLEATYQKCLGAMNLERWEEAKATCDQVFTVDPNYKDVQAKLREVEGKLAEVKARTPTLAPMTPTSTPKPSPLRLYTDTSWLTYHKESSGWESLGFDDSAWTSSSIVTYYLWSQLEGMDPKARWIWNPNASPNVPIFFRKTFTLKPYQLLQVCIFRVTMPTKCLSMEATLEKILERMIHGSRQRVTM